MFAGVFGTRSFFRAQESKQQPDLKKVHHELSHHQQHGQQQRHVQPKQQEEQEYQ